jgi:GxxExxY protein
MVGRNQHGQIVTGDSWTSGFVVCWWVEGFRGDRGQNNVYKMMSKNHDTDSSGMGGYDLIITKYQKMPIITSVPVTHFSQAAFHRVDSVVTGLAFDIQNELGRFLGEELYQAELVRRLRLGGFDAEPEMKIIVRHGGFEKHYFVDILVDAGVIVETKAVESIGSSHRAQLINYLYLCDLNHGTLLNFRTSRVQKVFVSTHWNSETRKIVKLDLEQWSPLTERCDLLKRSLTESLAEFGLGLDVVLYRDLITHCLEGVSIVTGETEVFSGGVILGTQKVHLLSPDVAFSITASSQGSQNIREHQRRFLSHTALKAIQWINLTHKAVTLTTIRG